MKPYLENRRQYCKVNGNASKTGHKSWCSTRVMPRAASFLSVHQRSPILSRKSNVSMYADYTCLYYSFDSVDAMNQAINADLTALKGWPEGNKLSLNVAKAEAMIIGTRGGNYHI